MNERRRTLVREVGIRLDIVRSLNMLRDGESMGAMGEASLVTMVAQHPGLPMLAIAIAKDTVRTTCIELERNQRSRTIAINFTHHGGLALLFGKRLRSKANGVHSGDGAGRNIRRELGFLGFTTRLAHGGREARRRRNGFRSTCFTLVTGDNVQYNWPGYCPDIARVLRISGQYPGNIRTPDIARILPGYY